MSQKIETIFKYNGKEYEFDVSDAECTEKLEAAADKMREEESKIPKTGLASEIIKAQCNLIKNYFDNCLGEGKGNEICTEKNKLSVCYDAHESFLLFVKAQNSALMQKKNSFSSFSNRQQRRAATKANSKK